MKLDNSTFTGTYTLSSSDFNADKTISPKTVLDLFQIVAGKHAEKFGIGFEEMLAKNLLWVVLKVKFTIIQAPEINQTVTVKTWPKKPRRIDFEREYLIQNQQGETLVKGTSQWAVIDSVTRKLTKADNVYGDLHDFCQEENYQGKLSRVEDFVQQGAGTIIKIDKSYLDSNNHVNNAFYADFVLNAINPKEPFEIEQMQIDFHKELLENDSVEIFYQQNNKEILAKGVIDGAIMFSCKINTK